ncbi:hypothetical protein GCM10023321_50440 [Pseudonocardia eucalypti]|uniref:Uncharacterized protein n=1 Tax=Pseudonocardia eucalypti TaxID=648755 RepID=A0ABP9QKK0_9PSEU
MADGRGDSQHPLAIAVGLGRRPDASLGVLDRDHREARSKHVGLSVHPVEALLRAQAGPVKVEVHQHDLDRVGQHADRVALAPDGDPLVWRGLVAGDHRGRHPTVALGHPFQPGGPERFAGGGPVTAGFQPHLCPPTQQGLELRPCHWEVANQHVPHLGVGVWAQRDWAIKVDAEQL